MYLYIYMYLKQLDVFSLLQQRQLFIHLHAYVFVCGRQNILYILMYMEHLLYIQVLPAQITYGTVPEGVILYIHVRVCNAVCLC